METLHKSKAIQKLYDEFNNNYRDDLVWLRHDAYVSAKKKFSERIHAIQYANGLSFFLKSKPVCVQSYDILAGHGQYVDCSASIPIIIDSRFDPSVSPATQFDIEREIACYREFCGGTLSTSQEDCLKYLLDASKCGLAKRWANGHVIAGYERVLTLGFAEMERQLKQQIEETRAENRDYFEAMLITTRAAQIYIGRYEQAATRMKKQTSSQEERDALSRIGQACAGIKSQPAQNFFEAVQLVWLLHEMLTYENQSGSMSLGRLDQILYPYYINDIESGAITHEQAGEWIDALWLKFAAITEGYQNVTLGGCDKQGNATYNELTLLCMRASRRLRQDQPLLSLRCRADMPEVYWDEAQDLIESGGGFPALFNDDIVISAKEDLGVTTDDARNYGIVGCVEPSVPGKEYSNTEELRINWAKILDLMMNGGACPMTGITMEMAEEKSLDNINDFETFYNWYKRELVFSIDRCIQATNMLDSSYCVYFPSPLLSATMEGCSIKGEDVSARGPVYCFSTMNSGGMANAVDSLSAIRQIVFEEKLVNLGELAEVLKANFSGKKGEKLMAYARNKCSKYGNDIEKVDTLMQDVTDLFCKTAAGYENKRGGTFQVGLYTVFDHAVMGKNTGALPEGRKRGVSLANAISPSQGMDIFGPTAAINSALSFSHRQAGNGLVLDLKFSPSFFQKQNSRLIVRALLQSYFDRGGMEAQINVVDRQTLLDAQKNPEEHRNLLVRVSGFSAYFVLLDPVLQDEIIMRTEYYGI